MVTLRNSGRKQQTRLSFNPLPTSSPAASALPEQIQNRAAAVRYDTMGSPTKKRRLRPSPAQAKLVIDTVSSASNKAALPTPEPSSQIEAIIEKDGAHSLQSTTSSEDDEPITPRKNGRRRRGFMGTHDVEGVDGLTTQLHAGRKQKNKPHQKCPSTTLHPTVDLSTSDESDIPSPSKRARKTPQRPLQATPQSSVTVVSEEESEPIPVKSSKRGERASRTVPQTPQNSRQHPSPTSSSSLQFKQVSIPTNRLRQTTATPTRSSKNFDASPSKKIYPKKRHGQPSPRLHDSVQPESDESNDSLMDELRVATKEPERELSISHDDTGSPSNHAIKSPGRKRRKHLINISSSVDESDSAEGSPRVRNRPQDKKEHTGFTRAKQETNKKSTRQKQLDLLRRRRAGKADGPMSDDDDLEIQQQDSELDVYSDEPVELEDEESGTERVRRAIPPNLDEYEEDFVDDDDDTTGAHPDLADIPLEFTRHAHKRPIEHFKDVVEWMIHNKLNPAFARNDPVYTIAVRKLDDVVQGYAGSKFMSSAWKAEFLEALKKYPDCTKIDVPTMHDRKCEACGRSGHPAKNQLTFSGKPYDRESLEDVSSDDDDEEEEEGTEDPESETHSPQIHVKAFFLGRTCNANAETAHALHHWRHQLNQFVLICLRSEGHLAPDKILERDRWNTKKKEKYANGVVDEMEANGQMKELYREFKQNLEIAREAKNEGSYFYGRNG
ncbi:MAG: hypothetical protein Q9205_006241 [Flavoplaca limonia]